MALSAGKARMGWAGRGIVELCVSLGLSGPAWHALAELLGFVDWNSIK